MSFLQRLNHSPGLAFLVVVGAVAVPIVGHHFTHPHERDGTRPVRVVQPVPHHEYRADYTTAPDYKPTLRDLPRNGEIDVHCGRRLGSDGPLGQIFVFGPTAINDWNNCAGVDAVNSLTGHRGKLLSRSEVIEQERQSASQIGDPDKVNQVFSVLPGGASRSTYCPTGTQEVPTSPFGIKVLNHFKCDPISGSQQDVAPFDSNGSVEPVAPVTIGPDVQKPAPIERRPSQKPQGLSN